MSLLAVIVVCLFIGAGIGIEPDNSAWRLFVFLIAAVVAIELGYIGGTMIEHAHHSSGRG